VSRSSELSYAKIRSWTDALNSMRQGLSFGAQAASLRSYRWSYEVSLLMGVHMQTPRVRS